LRVRSCPTKKVTLVITDFVGAIQSQAELLMPGNPVSVDQTVALICTLPRSGRKPLYLASHAAKITDMPLPEARVMLSELREHATRPGFVHAHRWQDGGLVIWDNRATMHRATAFDDINYRRELRRVTTLDLAEFPAVSIAAE
jgi:alpha-ketoglutarate-dependent taurine dioxygenase